MYFFVYLGKCLMEFSLNILVKDLKVTKLLELVIINYLSLIFRVRKLLIKGILIRILQNFKVINILSWLELSKEKFMSLTLPSNLSKSSNLILSKLLLCVYLINLNHQFIDASWVMPVEKWAWYKYLSKESNK